MTTQALGSNLVSVTERQTFWWLSHKQQEMHFLWIHVVSRYFPSTNLQSVWFYLRLSNDTKQFSALLAFKTETCCVKSHFFSVCCDNVMSVCFSVSPLRLYPKVMQDGWGGHDLSTECSFFICGNGCHGDSIPAVARETQQQRQPCCQAEQSSWFLFP